MLRAQNSASVVSNASHSSAASGPSLIPVDPYDTNPSHHITGPTHPTPSRRNRSSSSASARSTTAPHHNAHHPMSQASADRAAALGTSLSRNPSVSASGPSGACTPARQFSENSTAPTSVTNLSIRPPPFHANSGASMSNMSICPTAGSQISSPAAPSTPNLFQSPMSIPSASSLHPHSASEADKTRLELDRIRQENIALRQRIKDLERALKPRRESQQSDIVQTTSNAPSAKDFVDARNGAGMPPPGPVHGGERPASAAGGMSVSAWAAGTSGASVAGPRERSESQSTTASSRRGLPVEDRDDGVRVGESANNAGLR